jgi:hypothetical protein
MIFEKRWAAIMFVSFMMLSAVSLVGTHEEAGALSDVQQQVAGQRQAFEQTVGELDQPAAEPVADEEEVFADDEELFDFADGDEVDPENESADNAAASTETVVELVDPDEQES